MKKTVKALLYSFIAIIIASASPVLRANDLEKAMHEIDNNTKVLKQTIGDPAKKAQALAAIDKIVKSAEVSKTLTPKKAAELPEADRAKFIDDYSKALDGLIAQFKKIQTDLAADKMDDAKADFDQIRGMKRDGHNKFAAKN